MAPWSLTEGLPPWQGEGVFLKVLTSPAFSGSVKPRVQWFTLQNKTKSGIFLLSFSRSNKLSFEFFPCFSLLTLSLPCRQVSMLWEGSLSCPQKGSPVTAKGAYTKIIPCPTCLAPLLAQADLETTTARDVCAWALPFCPVLAVHLCLLLKPSCFGSFSQRTATSLSSWKGDAAVSQHRKYDNCAIPSDVLQKAASS